MSLSDDIEEAMHTMQYVHVKHIYISIYTFIHGSMSGGLRCIICMNHILCVYRFHILTNEPNIKLI